MRSRAGVYMVASALGFSTMAMLVKLVDQRLPTGEIVFTRAVVTLVLSYVMVRRAGLSPWGTTQRGRVMFRGLLGFLALSCFYLSIARLELPEATTLQSTTPLITTVLAWWLLRERIAWATAFAIACGLGGVMMIKVPAGAHADPAGVAIAVLGAGFSAWAYVTVRQLSRTEHPLVIVFAFPLVATPPALPWAAWDVVWPTGREWLLLVGIGAATQVGQVFLTLALSVEHAGRAMALSYLQICFAVVWQLVVFDEWPQPWMLAGAALIIGGALVVSMQDRIART